MASFSDLGAKVIETAADLIKDYGRIFIAKKKAELDLELEHTKYDSDRALELKKMADQESLKHFTQHGIPKDISPLYDRRLGEAMVDMQHANIHHILCDASQQMDDPTKMDKLKPDWFLKFLDYAKNISEQDMRAVWSKILVGETNKPESYSVATMDALSKMSKRELECFQRVSRSCVEEGLLFRRKGKKIKLRTEPCYWWSVDTVFFYHYLQNLRDTSIFRSTTYTEEVRLTQSKAIFQPPYFLKLSNSNVIAIRPYKESLGHGEPLEIEMFPFSNVGKELFRLIDLKPYWFYFLFLEEAFPEYRFECYEKFTESLWDLSPDPGSKRDPRCLFNDRQKLCPCIGIDEITCSHMCLCRQA
ncbi:MAG: DUF2806 domain-containing protein [Zetaproteobacteria bacterium]|nr:DUF2806 domain-containing protein [Zetaproteobacteria bacterium]